MRSMSLAVPCSRARDLNSWEDHILDPVAGHPELAGHWEWVRDTIRRPEGIYQDATHRQRRSYYKAGLSTLPGFPVVKVVVEFPRFNRWQPGDVVTAYVVDKVKQGEVLEWSP